MHDPELIRLAADFLRREGVPFVDAGVVLPRREWVFMRSGIHPHAGRLVIISFPVPEAMLPGVVGDPDTVEVAIDPEQQHDASLIVQL